MMMLPWFKTETLSSKVDILGSALSCPGGILQNCRFIEYQSQNSVYCYHPSMSSRFYCTLQCTHLCLTRRGFSLVTENIDFTTCTTICTTCRKLDIIKLLFLRSSSKPQLGLLWEMQQQKLTAFKRTLLEINMWGPGGYFM